MEQQTESKDVDLFGFRFDVGLDPIEVNVERMIGVFRRARRELGDVVAGAAPDTPAVMKLADRGEGCRSFHMDDAFGCAWSTISPRLPAPSDRSGICCGR